MKRLLAVALVLIAGTEVPAYVQTTPNPRFALIDQAVNEAIAQKKLPGAVILVGRGHQVLFKKAYGNRAVEPAVEKMTVDTIFDLASLTKVVATTTAVMSLVEDGKIRLTDPVASFIPEFGKYGKDRVTVRHLMTHMSGLRPDLDLGDSWTGYDTAIKLASDEVLTSTPGTRFVYSDINFELLAEIVQRVSKRPYKDFVQERIFRPLGMKDTMYLPPASLRARIAPTEKCTDTGWPCPDTTIMRGIVHDPTARRMGGVAGHAGLFSTADDLSKFCQMLLNGGASTVPAARVLSPLTVSRMTSPATPAGEANVRGLGWDIDSSYSANRGELLPLGSFGHTGFTGTSLWLDPTTGTYIVFLSNRVHPDGKGDVTPLRAKVASIVASTLVDVSPAAANRAAWSQRTFDSQTPAVVVPAPQPVLTGIDVLAANGFAQLKDLRVGLVTNHTGRAKNGQSTIDLLYKALGPKLTALFSPEHGIRGILDEKVPAEKDDATGLPIYSLYGDEAHRRPTDAMLANVDAIVIDLQDVGVRFYTYATTVAYVLEEAAPRHKKVFILDRPNPIGGVAIEGPALDATATSFVGYFAGMPIRHGMTLGELAKLFNAEKKIGADLTVIAMKNWRRDEYYDETGLAWINPSPNMRNLYAATLYPGVGMIEYANVSVGRGTDTPFEQIGAPWINGPALSDALNARKLPGLRFYPVTFTPTTAKFPNELCQGVFIVITDRTLVRSVRLGAELAAALIKMSPKDFSMDLNLKLIGSAADIARLKAGDDPATIAASWSGAEARWRLLRAKYLLY
jgi:uncharacterized protein YbbC (DUF1343 family)/CubicO group peptidase (beta-lactamase class C family)